MKVFELIEHLKSLPQNMRVIIPAELYVDYMNIETISCKPLIIIDEYDGYNRIKSIADSQVECVILE